MLQCLKTVLGNITLQFLRFHYNLIRLSFLTLRVFRTLMKNGFCKPPEEDEDDGEGEGDDYGNEQDGTGMGEGQGREDVTDEIEDEEQLLGLKEEKEEKENEQPIDNEEKKGDDGLEMENDFEGEMHDVEDNEDE